jgi:hypothetical protein
MSECAQWCHDICFLSLIVGSFQTFLLNNVLSDESPIHSIIHINPSSESHCGRGGIESEIY